MFIKNFLPAKNGDPKTVVFVQKRQKEASKYFRLINGDFCRKHNVYSISSDFSIGK
jgi:hypothetical protein